MKKLGILIIVLVVLVAGGPLVTGFMAESRFRTIVDSMTRNSGDLKFSVTKYSKGYLGADAEITVELVGDGGAAYKQYMLKSTGKARPFIIVLNSKVHHGPIPFAGKGFAFKPMLAGVTTRIGTVPHGVDTSSWKYDITTVMGMFGGANTEISAPAMEGKWGADTSFKWEGMELAYDYSSDLAKIDATGKVPSISVTNKYGTFVLKGMTASGGSREVIKDLPVGQSSGELKEMTITSPGTEPPLSIRLGELKVSSKSDVSGDLFSAEVVMSMKSFGFNDIHIGPLSVKVVMSKLHAGSLAKIRRTVLEISRGEMNQQQKGMMALGLMSEVLGPIMKNGPLIELQELKLVTPYGDVTGNMRFTVDTSNPEALTNIFTIKDTLVLDANWSVPEKLVRAIAASQVKKELQKTGQQVDEAMLGRLVQQRMDTMMKTNVARPVFRLENGVYKLKFSLNKGRMTLNGEAIRPRMGL